MIRTHAAAGHRVITLDRPDRRNALRPADLDALEAAVTGADEPVVLLRGAGPAFCAGADLDVVADLDDVADLDGLADLDDVADLDEPAEFARHGQRVADAIESADPVVVAGVDGAARGGGVELALACDLRVATPGATFAETGVRLGLFGAWGGTVRLPRVMREGDALDFALSGRVVDADEARRLGLVSRVVDDPEEVAADLADNPADALRTLKTRLRDRGPQPDQEAAEAEAFARLVAAHADDIAERRS